MSGGGGGGDEPPAGFKNALTELGDNSANLVGQIKSTKTFDDLSSGSLRQRGSTLNGAQGAQTFGNFGVAGFNSDNNRAFNQTRRLSANDSFLNNAGALYQNNGGVNALQGLNINQAQSQAQGALQRFQPNALSNLNFDQLKGVGGLAGIGQQQALSRGENLDVANNPFLADALAAAQRQTTDQYTQNVAPALASQFGGGFGLTGSSSINAQRRAADDLTRNLSEQATLTYADQFNRERAAQDQASQFLGGLDLNRAQSLGELNLNRAGQIDSARLTKAGQLGELGLGFTNAGIDRGQALGDLRNQQAAGLSAVGQARRQQQFQQINALNDIGNQQRQFNQDLYSAAAGRQNGGLQTRLNQFATLSGILGQNKSGTVGTGGPSRAQGALGGAVSGAAAGTAISPGYGTAIGAVGGGLLGYFGSA